MATTVAIGVVKTLLAFAGDWTRRVVPRAALLGSIAGVAILLIAYLPMLKIFHEPLAGLVALLVLFLGLFARVRMPFGMPSALAAVLAGLAVHWAGVWVSGARPHAIAPGALQLALPLPTLLWLDALPATLPYLAIALPFALVTIVGGIDNTESAAVAGDEYRTRDILLTEALATVLAGACGGVVQNTPYIGHPAYKAMGARAGYTLMTALVIGLGAMVGALSVLVTVLPEAVVAPILVFVGLEITAQAFHASPRHHGPAVALALVPVAAAMVMIQASGLLAGVGKSPADLTGRGRAHVAGAPSARQRLHPHRGRVGLGAGGAARPPPRGRGRRVRRGERGDPLRGHALARARRRGVLAVGTTRRRSRCASPGHTGSSPCCAWWLPFRPVVPTDKIRVTGGPHDGSHHPCAQRHQGRHGSSRADAPGGARDACGALDRRAGRDRWDGDAGRHPVRARHRARGRA
jgi:hypothetical protein